MEVKKIEVKESVLNRMLESLDKAISMIDLVQQQLMFRHEAGGLLPSHELVATAYQQAAVLESAEDVLGHVWDSLRDVLVVPDCGGAA